MKFSPASCPIPNTSSANAVLVAAHDLADALSHPTPAAPFAKLGNSQLCAIEDLAIIFDQAIVRTPPEPLLVLYILLVAVPPSPRVTLSSSTVPAPSLKVPEPPISLPNLIEPGDSDEQEPSLSQPR